MDRQTDKQRNELPLQQLHPLELALWVAAQAEVLSVEVGRLALQLGSASGEECKVQSLIDTSVLYVTTKLYNYI